jgi:catechol 2,3-dioxygenase-like lactoylglutathione lyase family enzyme
MKGIRHIGIVVSDLEKALHFYGDILGFKVKRDMIESGEYIDNLSALKEVQVRTVKMAADDDNLIEFLYYQSNPRSLKEKDICDIGYSHIAFIVENLDEEYRRLKAKNIKFNSPPQISPDGKVKVAFCRDAEGNLIELVEEIT